MGGFALLYGVACYALFQVTFLYPIGFVGDLGLPRTVDAGGPAAAAGWALAIDVGLLGIFGIQHSAMARRGFKERWTRVVPAPIERSTYVLLSSLALILLFWQWRPLEGVVWDVQAPAARFVLWTLFAAGWVTVLVSTFLIGHADLLGLAQVWRSFRRDEAPAVEFQTPLFYRFVRHPIYFGFLVAFWATPTMTAGHLLFAAVTTAYVLVAIRLEERDLRAAHTEYAGYATRVPMLIPGLGRRAR